MTRTLLLLALSAALAACGPKPVRYLPAPVPSAPQVRLHVGTLVVKDVVLPVYATEPEMLVEAADGALSQLGRATWADETEGAVTQALASALAATTTAQVAAEPWPLAAYPDAELTVRFDRFVARADGTFVASGQFAVASPDRRVRESITRFSVVVPVAARTPQAIAAARAAAIDGVAAEVRKRLS